jgi:hypothetical protein
MRSIVEIPFYSDNVQAVRDGEQVWVVVKRVSESLGIDHDTQRVKLKEKPWAVTGFIPATGPDGKTYEVFCLDLKSLPLWLATIDAGRVKPEVRFQLVAYQRECAEVLARHFFGAPATTGSSPELAAMVVLLREMSDRQTRLENNQAALWQRFGALVEQMPVGGAIAAARHNALVAEIRTLADVEVRVGSWPKRRAALADIRRELGEATEWGGKGKPWNTMPAALEPAARAVLLRRMRAATKTTKPAQLTLLKTEAI